MVTILVVCCVVGLLIAQRFNFLLLIPVMLVAAIFAALFAYHEDASFRDYVKDVFGAITALDLGYFAGLMLRLSATRVIHYLTGR